MPKDVVGYAVEAIQRVEELQRISTTQVAQAHHLQDHVRVAERHIDEVDSERQLSLEKRIREVEGMVENLRHDSKAQHVKFLSQEQDC